MAKQVVIIEDGKRDKQNDIIKIDGVKFGVNKIPLFKQFDISPLGALGFIDPFIQDGVIKAEVDLPDEYKNAHYSVGIKILKAEINLKRGKTVTECTLVCVCVTKLKEAKIFW